ncbi:DexA exonuclease A [Vibrio phage nt-1]|uniref:DexA exonuclease A n=1 Tax=Vibrio phage nt-1 TaxID=115992 RepID=R9TF49_9CAUD|nr:DexA exonuclease A [Vibrio phage nt-1]AGN30074.1 DexA exonuclease A [Vibrio phage nt-1]
MTAPIDIIIDYEGLNVTPDAAVIELGAVAFEHDFEKVPNYQELVQNGFRCKFDIKHQKGRRSINKATVEWWKSQSEEAKAILIPSGSDVSVEEGHRLFIEWIENNTGYNGKSHFYCRGNNYDIPLMADCFRDVGLRHAIVERFWKFRDVRTRIESLMLQRDMTKVPVKRDLMPGFIHHNGIHDCAKDAMMLILAARYALDLEELPEKMECHEVSVDFTDEEKEELGL